MKISELVLGCGTKVCDHDGPLWMVAGYRIDECHDWKVKRRQDGTFHIDGERSLSQPPDCWFANKALAHERAANAMVKAAYAIRDRGLEPGGGA